MLRTLTLLLALGLSSLPLSGCSTSVYQPGRGTGFELDAAKEINDDDVRKAFEAKPQLTTPLRVAFYTYDLSKSDDIEKALRQVPGVSDVYRLPPLMVTGQRRYDEGRAYGGQSTELSIKKLRLLAARAHADVVLVVDYGNKVEGSANGWVALTPLLLPIFFVPFIDRKVESYLDTYLIDTRNGYLYAHVTSDEKNDLGSGNIYTDTDPTVRTQWEKLLNATRERLAAVAASAGSRVAVPASAPPASSSAPPAPSPTPSAPPAAKP